MSDDQRPCDTEAPADAVASFEMYRKARQRFEGRDNVVPFRPRQMAEQQTLLDLANAFRSTEAAGKYDDEGDAS